jgi:membrane protein implicated in regulation of membrane protease activity
MTSQNNLTLLILVTVLFIVGGFIYTAFGDVATLVYAVIVLAVLVAYLLQLSGQLTAVAIVRSTLDAWTEAQAADDKGEVERMKGLRIALGQDVKTGRQPQTIQSEWAQLPPPPTWTPAPQRMLSMVDDNDGMRVDIER